MEKEKGIQLLQWKEKEEGIKIKKFETWHNPENEKLRAKIDAGRCGGVPFFVNQKTGVVICGATSYENLKMWAKGK